MKTVLHPLVPAAMACMCLAAEPVQEKITMRAGETVTRTLAGNPTTGYLWKAEPLPEDAPVRVETAVVPGARRGKTVCGAPSPTRVSITARKPGMATVAVHYARPWERDTPPSKTVRYEITVLPRE